MKKILMGVAVTTAIIISGCGNEMTELEKVRAEKENQVAYKLSEQYPYKEIKEHFESEEADLEVKKKIEEIPGFPVKEHVRGNSGKDIAEVSLSYLNELGQLNEFEPLGEWISSTEKLFQEVIKTDDIDIEFNNLVEGSRKIEKIQKIVRDTAQIEVVSDTKSEVLESPYKEIKDYFDSYQLPEGGTPGEFEGIIEYENGYAFDEKTKTLVSRKYPEESGPAEPTEEQKTGVVMGWLLDAAELGEFENMTVTNYSEQMEFPISRLNQVNELTESVPLKEWISETVAVLDEAQKMEMGDERQKALKEGYDRLQKMSSLIQE